MVWVFWKQKEMSRVICCADWSAKQEYKLLEGLEEYGYGNWSSVSLKVGKTPSECKEHYDHYYVQRHLKLLPEFPICPLTNPKSHGDSSSPLVKEEKPENLYYPGTEIAGYMPRRGDFTYEPDNNAERILLDLDSDPDDDELTTALNLAAIQIYQSRLAKRAFKKWIVREYGLLDIHRQNALDSSRLTRYQLRLKNVTKPFLRFMSPQSAAKFMQSHFLEDQLCSEIKKLQQYRSNGITTFRGVSLYERLLSERKRWQNNQGSVVRKNCSAEENLLFQVLQQGPLMKPKKYVFKPKPLDITYSAGVEKLDSQEKELCSNCRFQPEAYLSFKKQLVSECTKLGRLTLAEARKLLKVDVNKTRKVYDLLIAKGLINSTSGTT